MAKLDALDLLAERIVRVTLNYARVCFDPRLHDGAIAATRQILAETTALLPITEPYAAEKMADRLYNEFTKRGMILPR